MEVAGDTLGETAGVVLDELEYTELDDGAAVEDVVLEDELELELELELLQDEELVGLALDEGLEEGAAELELVGLELLGTAELVVVTVEDELELLVDDNDVEEGTLEDDEGDPVQLYKFNLSGPPQNSVESPSQGISHCRSSI